MQMLLWSALNMCSKQTVLMLSDKEAQNIQKMPLDFKEIKA
jgi:hypothetical protein